MPTYQCANCKRIAEFTEKYEYLLKEKVCPKCNKAGQFEAYSGPMTDAILDREDVKSVKLKTDLKAVLAKIDLLTSQLEKVQGDKKTKQQQYERIKTPTDQEVGDFKDEIEKANRAMVDLASEIGDLNTKKKDLDEQIDDLGNREAVRKDAPRAFQAAESVQSTSGKNKLYIGSRQYVSAHASQTKAKKLRILDVPNWSPGLNVSWVEGGIKAKAHFKIKLNQENQYHSIPEAVLGKFKANPQMDPDEFFKLCKADGKNSLLWYDKDGKNRPTWTALEIWCLLRAGYRFTFASSKSDASGQKIVLIPPA